MEGTLREQRWEEWWKDNEPSVELFKEQRKQVELGMHLGMVGPILPQEGSHDLSVRPYFPAEMLASCNQIYFFHRSCQPRIPREISPFLTGGKEFHFQEKKIF